MVIYIEDNEIQEVLRAIDRFMFRMTLKKDSAPIIATYNIPIFDPFGSDDLSKPTYCIKMHNYMYQRNHLLEIRALKIINENFNKDKEDNVVGYVFCTLESFVGYIEYMET